MALAPGTHLGVYEVTAQIGVGGMGEVYRATDSNLKRSVAIKVLPASVAGDTERLARFQREAEVLAALNHPNIAAIYGLEKSVDATALVMELVEGEDLSQRIARGAIPLDEALPIARQIAEALEAAHEQGIVHRDLKPANIKVRADGTVKVLDFGLAKAMDAGGSGAGGLSMSPTLSMHATQAGIILGTAAYMAPEQARGKKVDRRVDIWAFGCVLYEMLTGKSAFESEDVQTTIAAVLTREADWSALPHGVPQPARRVLIRCLNKDPRGRLQAIGDARIELQEPGDAPARSLAPTPSSSSRRLALVSFAALVAGATVATTVTALLLRSAPSAPLRPMRLSIEPPSKYPLSINAVNRDFVLSPDGSRVAYIASTGEGGGQVMIREMDRLDPQPLGSDAGARSPFFSPDGRWVGYFTGGALLKKISISGGEAVTLCQTAPGSVRGAGWGADGTIVFTSGTRGEGLYAVRDSGGERRLLAKPEAGREESLYLFPSVLPGGRTVLFTITGLSLRNPMRVAALDLKSGGVTTIIENATQAEYVNGGYLVYASGGGLRAVRFDPDRVQVSGQPAAIVDGVRRKDSGTYDFSVSPTGVVAYVPGGNNDAGLSRQMVWVDRQGHEQPINAPLRAYGVIRLSPDETRAVVDIRSGQSDIFTWNFARETLTPLTFEHGDDNPIWTSDGRRVVWVSRRDGAANLYWQAADGTGSAERLTTSALSQNPKAITPDGERIVFTQQNSRTSANDLHVLTIASRMTQPLLETAVSKNDPSVSPDGRWIAFESRESGELEIYVRPFPKVDAGRWQVSTGGGRQPQWARNGRELFFLDGAGLLTSARVDTKATFVFDAPRKILESRYAGGNGPWTYDVSKDGQRFLMLKDVRANDPTLPTSSSIVVMLNALEDVKRRFTSNAVQ